MSKATAPPTIPDQPPPGVPASALAQCSFNHNGQPLLTDQNKRWVFEDQRWKRVGNPDAPKKGVRHG